MPSSLAIWMCACERRWRLRASIHTRNFCGMKSGRFAMGSPRFGDYDKGDWPGPGEAMTAVPAIFAPEFRDRTNRDPVMIGSPVLTPRGLLTLRPEGDAPALEPEGAARLELAFARGSGHGLLALGADE